MGLGPTRWSLPLVLLAAALLLLVGACQEADEDADDTVAAGDDDSADDGDETEPADADDYPDSDIEMIIPFPPGSAPDGNFRTLAGIAEEELGVSIIIQNREGGGGTIGVGEIAEAEPDGSTIGMSPIAPLAIMPLLQDTEISGPEDITPITGSVGATFVVFAHSDSGMETVDDLVAAAEEAPGELTFGVPGEGSIPHIHFELIQQEAGIEMSRVPFSAGEQIPALLNQTIDVAISQPPIALEHAAEGTINILGIIAPEIPAGVDVPSFPEQGYDIDIIPFEFVVGPPGLPEDIVATLDEAFSAAIQSDEYAEYIESNQLLVEYQGPEELSERIQEETTFYRDFVRELGWTE